jgi:hypothetical protein
MRYVVEARTEEHALDEVVMNIGQPEFDEFSQKHIDEVIVSSRPINQQEFLELHYKDNEYLKDWTIEQKMRCVHSIDYKDDEE